MATAAKLGLAAGAQCVAQVLKNHVPMLLGGDDQCVQDGVSPQRGWFEPASRSPGLAQLLGEHEEHLITVLMPKRRRKAAQQRAVDRFGAHHAPRTSPVARACCTRAFNRSTSAVATRFPKRVSR